MASWFNEYMNALEIRDAQEKGNEETYNAYVKLADYSSSLRQSSFATGVNQTTTSTSPAAKAGSLKGPMRTPSPSTFSTNDITQLRTDLAAAQRSKAALQTQLTVQLNELQTLQKTYEARNRTATVLASEKAALERKLKDREEELREKARLVENVQDEMVGLEMQMNVAEERAKGLEVENKELVARYMRRIGKEAEEMNLEGGWNE